MRQIAAIIPAAGVGQRFGAAHPKQYEPLLGQPLLAWTLQPFLQERRIATVMLALSASDTHWSGLNIKHDKLHTTIGGAERFQTVQNALSALLSAGLAPKDWVFVHDGARACLHKEDLSRLIDVACAHPVGAILAEPVRDTLKYAQGQEIQHTVDRTPLWQAQTPQCFPAGLLLEALQYCEHNQITPTDEASAVEAMGLKPGLVPAQHPNPKITYPHDMRLAEALLNV